MTTDNSIIESSYNLFDQELKSFINNYYPPEDHLREAISYSLASQGKRVRPMLVLLSCQAFKKEANNAIASALAIEMIHAYSLIHDDLPCMDNDILRRGQPTTHIEFGEGCALLAGDALLSDAFNVLTSWKAEQLSAAIRLKQVSELSAAIGSHGMVLGQHLDLYWTDREGASTEIIDKIHVCKTGKLLGASCALGAIAAEADNKEVDAFRQFGEKLGLAFQIQDDLIDGLKATGKSAGKDQKVNKLTYLKFMSQDQAHSIAKELIEQSVNSLTKLGQKTSPLLSYSLQLIDRTN
ncbi:MAG: polyprenyl synthetase family protein [Bdellovibrionota bacterium]